MLARIRHFIGSYGTPMTEALGKLVHVQRGGPDVPSNRRQREAFMRAYADAIQAVPNIEGVRVRDRVSYLDVYTTYRGDIRTFEDDIYSLEASVMDKFPDVRVNWHLVDAAQDGSSASPSAGSSVSFTD